ncbi:hypothetical protein [Candidatus Nanohalococcus occultus]|uniref:hypothetical protein n=1 Tax=Candidatus Nanohalococcus occultus TaxID=2978047 RepID=UPI0039DFC78F
MLRKIPVLLATTLTTVGTVLAHNESGQYYGPGMMDGGAWTHNMGHMAGYKMWGMGWYGLLFGLAFWILVILGIIYLVQKITEQSAEKEDN